MRKVLVFVLCMTAFAGSARAQFCAGVAPWVFTDVPANDAFCGFVTWMAQTGITTGCQVIDANNRRYCPDDFVTRKQMSAFMSRLGKEVAFVDGGNAFGNAAVLGTNDNQPLDIRVNGSRIVRYQHRTTSPNILAGNADNSIDPISQGVVIAGGGWGLGSMCNAGRPCINAATGDSSNSVIGGGVGNYTMSSPNAVIAGGSNNVVNAISGATIGGGSGNTVTGFMATIPGGLGNSAGGSYAMAMGNRANAALNGCAVWSDSSSPSATSCFANNEFVARAVGGFYFWTSGNNDSNYAGARLAPGAGAWAAYSDSAGKENSAPVDPVAIAHTLAALPIATWNWKAQDANIRHMGPTAQDFRAAFGLGESERMISSVDTDGVALAAIQGVYRLLQQKDAEITALATESISLRGEMAELRRTVERLLADRQGR